MQIRLFLTAILMASTGLILKVIVELPASAQVSASQILELPPPPPDPPPQSEPPSGPPDSLPVDACIEGPEDTSLRITAIRPRSSIDEGLTARNNPTLLFYIPQSPEIAPRGEFAIESQGRRGGLGTKEIYRNSGFQLSNTPGIVAATLPNQVDGSSYLEAGKYYRWYFKVYCKTARGRQIPQEMEGWIRRVTPETVPPDTPFYYDLLVDAARDQTISDNVLESNPWQDLLETLGWEAYTDVPIVEEIDL